MNRGYRRPNHPGFSKQRRFRRPDEREGFRIHTNTRVRKLNMRRIVDFKWDLSNILKEVPAENVTPLKGAIYAKASKIGIHEARDFITEKEKEGMITPETAIKIGKLLHRYSVFR